MAIDIIFVVGMYSKFIGIYLIEQYNLSYFLIADIHVNLNIRRRN